MGRPLRPTAEDVVYHVLNWINLRRSLCEDNEGSTGQLAIESGAVIIHFV